MSRRQPTPIPDAVRRFILTSVPSVPFLEAARLFRSAPGVAHTRDSVAAALYVSSTSAQKLLGELAGAGIVRDEAGVYRYAPRDSDLDQALQQLFECYEGDLIGVTHLIHDSTQRSAERFSNAFRFRKDPNNG